jgi:hypothetical protein
MSSVFIFLYLLAFFVHEQVHSGWGQSGQVSEKAGVAHRAIVEVRETIALGSVEARRAGLEHLLKPAKARKIFLDTPAVTRVYFSRFLILCRLHSLVIECSGVRPNSCLRGTYFARGEFLGAKSPWSHSGILLEIPDRI